MKFVNFFYSFVEFHYIPFLSFHKDGPGNEDRGTKDSCREPVTNNSPFQAFYQRGLAKMKLKHAKGIHDFNRALAINSTLFQVSLWQTVSNVCTRLGEVGEAVEQRDRSKI